MSENGRNVTNGTLAKHRDDMDRFLEKLRESGNIRLACEAADINRRTVYRWRDRFATFADEWDEALDDALDLLEGEAWKRARKQSDRLLMYLLTAHRPEKYGDKVRVDSTGTLTIEVKGGYRNHSD
jgi:hypothetical protein